MPELPEVQTTVNGLQKYIVGKTITDVWTDLAVKNQQTKHYGDTLKDADFFTYFKKEVVGQKITGAQRRAKNILIELKNRTTILVHMKMTGHMMVGNYDYDKRKNSWSVSPLEKNDALRDPYNRFIHVVFSLSHGKQLVLCDARKFAKVTLIHNEASHHTHLGTIGPEPLDAKFTETDFKTRLQKKMSGKIKTVLLDQSIIAGIGNIYSDELLFLAGVHPERRVRDITQSEFKKMYDAMRIVLLKGIDFGGDSTSDYRNILGEKGKFHSAHNVYRKTKTLCNKKGCPGIIERKMIGGRSSHFCPVHQN
jgi:formamidopyrimidine-DNA glycosylase